MSLYEPCPFHKNQNLQMVCMLCEEACLACPICIDMYHNEHPIISLKKFITTEIPKLYQEKPNCLAINKCIQKMGHLFLQSFQGMRKSIGQQINELEQVNFLVYEVYQHEVQTIKKENEVICGQGSHIYTPQNIMAIKRKISQKALIPNEETILKQLQKVSKQIESFLQEQTLEICTTIKNLREYWNISCNLLLNSRQQIQFAFSQKNKHQLIDIKKIDNQFLAINSTFDSKYHIAVVEPHLNPLKNQIMFKIQQSTNNCIWIGICQLNKVKNSNFQNCYKKGQGCYWLWQGGGQDESQYFSDIKQQSESLSHNFKVGDIIRMKIQYLQGKHNKIVFHKVISQKEEESFLLLHEDLIQKRQFYACVGLGDQDQSVRIFRK